MILVWDCETDGIPNWNLPADDPSQPHIVEVAALLCDDDGNDVEEYQSLVKPEGWVIPEGAARVHGITTEIALAEGKPIAEVMDALEDMTAKASLIVAFNVRFDEKLRRTSLRRLGRPDGFGTVPVFCCMKGATPLCALPPSERMRKAGFAKFKTPNLGEAVRILLNREHAGAHRAMADVMATKNIYFACRDDDRFIEAGREFHTNSSKAEQ